jgi:LPXTG-motif cell wall-anchored protein
MDMINKRPGLAALVAFIAGLIIGLVVLGWWLLPVQFTGADPAALLPQYQAAFIRNAAELYSFDNNQEKLRSTLSGWGGDVLACELAQASVDPGDRARLVAAATIVNGQGCTGLAATGDTAVAGTLAPDAAATVGTGQEAADTGGSNLLPLLLLGLLLFLLLLAILYVWNRRRTLLEEGEAGEPEYGRPAPVAKSTRPSMTGSSATPVAAPATVALAAEPMAVPIARFRTAYTRGHDTYDDAFSIENANGDFLGECGVGISETLGATAPKNVTAFEVWLFDKNDIRTITKVIMSDHAFFDDALKAKLAPKGEPVLARESETIVLETATLIINAEITEMDYGALAELPDASYFERFTIELSAWAKEGEGAAAKPGEGEDLLRY